MALTKGQLLEKIAGIDDIVPITVHHQAATGVQLARNEGGDLAIDILLDVAPAETTELPPAETPAEPPSPIDETDKLEQAQEAGAQTDAGTADGGQPPAEPSETKDDELL